jgi:CRP/FNR family transcriptional regulator
MHDNKGMDKSREQSAYVPPTEFFAGIGKAQIAEILRAADVRKISAHRIILREGSPAEHLYLLKSGAAKLYRITKGGDEVLLSRVAPGDTFGLGTLLARPAPYMATAETIGDCEFLVWDQARIRGLARRYQRLAQNALGIVLRYLAGHFDRLAHLLTSTAEERVAHTVVHLGKKSGTVVPTGVEIAATNEEIAALANVSPFTVSRVLNKWMRVGALAKSRKKVFIQTPEKLMGN